MFQHLRTGFSKVAILSTCPNTHYWNWVINLWWPPYTWLGSPLLSLDHFQRPEPTRRTSVATILSSCSCGPTLGSSDSLSNTWSWLCQKEITSITTLENWVTIASMRWWWWLLGYDRLVINVLRLKVLKDIGWDSIMRIYYKVLAWVSKIIRNVGSAVKLRSNLWCFWIGPQSWTSISDARRRLATLQLFVCIVYHLHSRMTATERWGFVQLLIWIWRCKQIIDLRL